MPLLPIIINQKPYSSFDRHWFLLRIKDRVQLLLLIKQLRVQLSQG